MGIGKSINRVDAVEKVTGGAQYTDDFSVPNCLVAKVVRSTIANGWVKSFDLSEAEKVPGVVKIVTCFDTPDIQFPTPGHPWSVEPAHQDVSDRKLLNRRVRIYGDDIAAVIAEDEVAAARAARLMKVEYEEYPVYITPEQAMAEGAVAIHEENPDNVLKHSAFHIGDVDFDQAIAGEDVRIVEGEYQTQTVQHCHIEVPVSYAYMEKGRVVVVSSTQIPHIVRRVIGQANGIPWGKVRVIKPYIGGGFGNKQEVLYEPLNAFLTMQVGGRPVKLELSREETLSCTRVRHAIDLKVKTAVRPDGRLVARQVIAVSNQGGYASHGHAIVANAINNFRHTYHDEKSLQADAYTVYTNIASGGAMRGYGIPQAAYAMESHMDDIARAIGMDPIELREKNCMQQGYVDPMSGITCYSSGLLECIRKGKEYIHWEEKRKAYQDQTGPVRRGVGMALFSYKTGVYPISLETSSARLILNQDGSAQLHMGATEIGQGADTVFIQMAAETIGFREENIHIVSTQDTDVAPFDTGAYASRQTYVSGMAIKKTAELFKSKILDYANYMLKIPADQMDIRDGNIVNKESGEQLLTMEKLAMEAFYSLDYSVHITAETTNHCKDNTFSFGVCFAEVEVDIPVGKVKVLDIINVHDSGTLINPRLAEAQVHGGMSMGLGYALGEQLLFDDKGRPLNNNLLDYKLPTSMDTPELHADFVQPTDSSGPYGNKALGEPPAISPAPAIRNAVLNATGVAVNSIPMNPQKLVEQFQAAGLI
ncbi:xanthine dehydrogenase subunit XdhA [Marasmitruncus massiliensis]|uniref:xanthine dehydrogenase subunit XdhA n=1 Tax=Marasmitruncus massiliensis TaxID=1944642 RepID=UPI000C7A1DCB|nr:xanthine dehydrogenase subunit XdhA [Marasmitruncus massiliensis]